jgi:hypothetical protein
MRVAQDIDYGGPPTERAVNGEADNGGTIQSRIIEKA